MLSDIQKSILLRALRLRAEAGDNPADVLVKYKNLTEDEKQEILKELEE